MRTSANYLLITFLGLSLFPGIASPADESAEPFAVPAATQQLLKNNCVSCHGPDTEEANVRLDDLASLSLNAQLDLLNRVQQQLYLGNMPPQDAKQPTKAKREQLANWISAELRKHNAAKFEDKLRTPAYGNYVNHDKLFSSEYKDQRGFTYDRRWLISEFIFNYIHNDFM